MVILLCIKLYTGTIKTSYQKNKLNFIRSSLIQQLKQCIVV